MPRGVLAGLVLTVVLYALAAERYLSLAQEYPEASQGFHALLAASTIVALVAIILLYRYAAPSNR